MLARPGGRDGRSGGFATCEHGHFLHARFVVDARECHVCCLQCDLRTQAQQSSTQCSCQMIDFVRRQLLAKAGCAVLKSTVKRRECVAFVRPHNDCMRGRCLDCFHARSTHIIVVLVLLAIPMPVFCSVWPRCRRKHPEGVCRCQANSHTANLSSSARDGESCVRSKIIMLDLGARSLILETALVHIHMQYAYSARETDTARQCECVGI